MDIVQLLTLIASNPKNPYVWILVVLVALGYVMKHPKVIYPMMSVFPRVAGAMRIIVALIPDLNEVLDGATLVALGRVRKTKASEQAIYLIDKEVLEKK
jgi:hypothetical protein